ncbi:MAG: EamA family transporter [Bacilli bacterium]|nr:EamA family transporter [Bacilli bacterium]
MLWFYLIVSTVAWGVAEIFYKKGTVANEKYSHLKTTVFVGLFFGIYATIILFTQGVDLKSFPINFLYYLPVAACYILSMIFSYFGVRFIEESISDPIENTSIAFVPILCAIFLKETYDFPVIIGIVIIALGVIALTVFDRKGIASRKQKLGKKLAFFAIAMPFAYMILDSVGTFLDIFYTDDVASTLLINVTEENLEHTANCAYEFAFFFVAVGIFIFLKIKGEKLFPSLNEEQPEKWYKRVWNQKWKILAAIFEMIGQATYLFALSEGQGVAAVILGAGTVIISFVLSRIFLKEKLSILQYIFIGVIIGGIIMLSLLGL